ncbi:rRNA biogenesis protein rrp36 [Rhodotorula mucilaginosa]|uniref:rRNA biogenesis protein RRP36 n=1 Tax=Rhodotorula mucilaginosa TaxID=5537 RepID=A0A9P7B5H2_RHOMI|nr:rRNA biogenesis protein rrp36 [Rhodotorula mucilaginosa]
MPATRTRQGGARAPAAATFESDDDEQLFEQDSEEDEWATDRQAGPSRASAYQQDSDEDDHGEPGHAMHGDDDDDDGVAAFESDPGEQLEDSDDDADPEAAIGKQLASIPFTSLLKAQKQLNKGKQKANGKGKGAQEGGDDGARDANGKKLPKNAKGKGKGDHAGRSNKHAPTEMSARRPVSRARQVVETQELKSRDPRFDVLSGSVNKDLFRKSYSFLAEQHQQELETMRKTAAAARKNRQLPQEEKDRIDEALRRMENREVTRKNKDLQEEAMRQWKKEEADKRKEGKKAFFLKESEKKKLFLKAKYDDLAQDKRKLHKAMDKKRRKTSQKEKKLMPKSRPGPY